MKKTSTRRALMMSVLSLLLCASMLIGTTFAWFTDTVVSSGNIIKSGKLDISFGWADGAKPVPTADAGWTDASAGPMFDNERWEPGYTEAKHIRIQNEGNLALKFIVTFEADGAVSDLADVIDVYYLDPAKQIENRSDLAALTPMGTLRSVVENTIPLSGNGTLLEGQSISGTIVLKMQESAGNDYQEKSIGTTFSVKVYATQFTEETDSFGKDYDEKASYPAQASLTRDDVNDEDILTAEEVTVKLPVGAPVGSFEVKVESKNVTLTDTGANVNYDISLLYNGTPVSTNHVTPGVEYPVYIQLTPGLDIKTVAHKGVLIPDGEYDYNFFTGTLSFKTATFSPFSVSYDEVSVGLTFVGETITGGFFTNFDPTTEDNTLGTDASDYIVMSYPKGTDTIYSVSKASETLILAAPDSVYNAADYPVAVTPITSGSLFASTFAGLKNNTHNTVYLLPGSYTVDNCLYVYSSMDIIGLGNREDVLLTKSAGTSVRHVFNCSGEKEDYIQVTIHNMTIDARANASNGKGNNAVQCIRKTKVKCYNLYVYATNTFTAAAFCTNAKNAVGGVLYPVYIYVEDCVVSNNMVQEKSGTFTFYCYNLKYNASTKIKDYVPSTSYLGKVMYLDYSDWTW